MRTRPPRTIPTTATKDVKSFLDDWDIVYKDQNIWVLVAGDTYRVHFKSVETGHAQFPAPGKKNPPRLDVYYCPDPPCPDGLG
jgi:hypothetical protein